MGFTANLRIEQGLRFRKTNIAVAAVWSITLEFELLLINVLLPLLILPML